MRKLNGRWAPMTAAAGFVLALACSPGSAQDTPVTLRFSHWSPPQHPMSQIAVPEWVNAIEKASGGSIKIQVFPSQQLGKAIDHYDMARDGVADITWVNAGLQPGRFRWHRRWRCHGFTRIRRAPRLRSTSGIGRSPRRR
jgi:TRAP-type transport system periplasmic protein